MGVNYRSMEKVNFWIKIDSPYITFVFNHGVISRDFRLATPQVLLVFVFNHGVIRTL